MRELTAKTGTKKGRQRNIRHLNFDHIERQLIKLVKRTQRRRSRRRAAQDSERLIGPEQRSSPELSLSPSPVITHTEDYYNNRIELLLQSCLMFVSVSLGLKNQGFEEKNKSFGQSMGKMIRAQTECI